MSQKMSITALENEIRNNVLSNNKFGVLKFVDIGSGTGKLNNGVMQAEKLDKFLQALTESTVFLDNTKMILSDNDKMVLDTMSFDVELEAGRISGTPQVLSQYQNPNFLDRAFDAEELRALTGIHRTALRQNIEQKGFMNTLSERFGEACGRALERILIYGNKDTVEEGISTGYKVIDGICQKLKDDGDNDVEEIDLTASDSNVLDELRRMIDAYPDKYVEDGNLKLFVPEILKRSLLRYIADNKTGDASISYIKDKNQMSIEGITGTFSLYRNSGSTADVYERTTDENGMLSITINWNPGTHLFKTTCQGKTISETVVVNLASQERTAGTVAQMVRVSGRSRAWNNLTVANLGAEESSNYATCPNLASRSGTYNTPYTVNLSNFGFTLPANSVIHGAEHRIVARLSKNAPSNPQFGITILNYNQNHTYTTGADLTLLASQATSWQYFTPYTVNIDNFTASEVNASNFTTRVEWSTNQNYNTGDINWTYYKLTIYYSPPQNI